MAAFDGSSMRPVRIQAPKVMVRNDLCTRVWNGICRSRRHCPVTAFQVVLTRSSGALSANMRPVTIRLRNIAGQNLPCQ